MVTGMRCPNCGMVQMPRPTCKACGTALTSRDPSTLAPESLLDPNRPKSYPVSPSGSPSENSDSADATLIEDRLIQPSAVNVEAQRSGGKQANEEERTVQPLLISSNRSYFVRHWRGDLPLARSYWVNTFLVTALLRAFLTGLAGAVEIASHPTAYSLLAVAMWAILFAVTPWQLVGLWRSAVKDIEKSRRIFWPRVAQAVVVFAAIVSVYTVYAQAWPQVTEYLRIARGADTYRAHTIRVLRQGTELELSGAIPFGLTEEIEKHLDVNPDIRVIHLNSIGGRIAEARKLRGLIASRQLITYSAKGCGSACVDAFMGGKIRVLGRDAQLGFHQPSFPGMPADQLTSEIEAEKRYFIEAGVDAGFVRKAFAVPNNELWTPSPQELLQAGVITHISDGSDFAMSEADLWGDAKNIENELLKTSIYQAVKTHDPETYKQILTEFQNAARGRASRSELAGRTRDHLARAVQRHLPHASDDSLIDFTTVLIDEMNQLGSVSGELCYALLFSQDSGGVDFSRHLTQATQQAEMNAMARIIDTAATNPQAIPSEEEVANDLKAVMSRLVRRHGNDVAMLANAQSAAVDKAKTCTISVALYSEVLTLSRQHSAKLLRFMFVGQ